MVELLVVILIIAILIALLLPAILGAVRRARQASVISEINVLATDLSQFKSSYGFFPPSRLILNEQGLFPTSSAVSLAAPGGSDITTGQLAQRSLRYMQRMFPRVQFSTSATVMSGNAWYDFNGNGTQDGTYILQGPQCLVFFLGGIPIYDPAADAFTGMAGWGKNPVNPFSNSIQSDPRPSQQNPSSPTQANWMFSAARTTPIAEFKNSRLSPIADPTWAPFPCYWDAQSAPSISGHNVYTYFSAYEGAGYDPNDCNFVSSQQAEADTLGTTSPIMCAFTASGGLAGSIDSPSPNPYTVSLTTPVNGTVSYQQPQSYQILAAGDDGFFGLGGQYTPNSPSDTLPFDLGGPGSRPSPYNTPDRSVRLYERDNLTSFATGALQ